MRLAFDRQWKDAFLLQIPTSPGVYQIFDADGTLIYVGKAKNLRRRLSQYKNASRRKKHRKMKRIVREAVSIELLICSHEFEAETLETSLIQQFRPRWNVVGAFYFLYPMLGLKVEAGIFSFSYTTHPEEYGRGFQFFGAYRSREITQTAYLSLMNLLQYVGHPLKRVRGRYEKRNHEKRPRFSREQGFRQIPEEWESLIKRFLRGESREFLEALVLALLENAGARGNKCFVQGGLNDLIRFWEHEAERLHQVCHALGHPTYPVTQRERDFLFLKYRHQKGNASQLQSPPSETPLTPGEGESGVRGRLQPEQV